MAAEDLVSIIVPTRNEVENVTFLVEKVIGSGFPISEIIFVDADSNDGTRETIVSLSKTKPVRLLEQIPSEPGLAAGIMAGVRSAMGDLIVVMDADLSHPPDQIGNLLAPIISGEADLVIGSRYIPGGSTPGWPLWRRIMSRTAGLAAYPLTGVNDSMSGFFAISRTRLLDLAPPAIGFKIAFETILRGRSTLRIREVPIAFRDRTRGRSKMSFGVALRFLVRWIAALLRRVVVI